MKKYLITISYIGKNYCGWQKQKNGISIQETIETVLSRILQQEINLFASGRTDAGVNALAQTAHFCAETNMDKDKILFACNSLLPDDISINKIKIVKQNFHARFDVKEKIYEYNFYEGKQKNIFLEPYAYYTKSLKTELMLEAGRFLTGEHDFSAFCASNSSVEDFVRQIKYIKIVKKNSVIKLIVSGNGFLYNMVRIIAGTLQKVGLEEIEPDAIKSILDSKDRKNAGRTLPAKALYLTKVKY